MATRTHPVEGDWTLHDLPFEAPGALKEVLFKGDLAIDDLLLYES